MRFQRAIKSRSDPPRPYAWEIYDDERDDAPVRQSARRFGTFREAWTAGWAALEKIRARSLGARRRCWVLQVERQSLPPPRRSVVGNVIL
jgi:hypothetical protein